MVKKIKDLEENLPMENQINIFDKLEINVKGDKIMSRFEKALEKINNGKDNNIEVNKQNNSLDIIPSIINISEVANTTLGNKNSCKEYSTITIRIKNSSLEKLDLLKSASGRSRSYIVDNLIDNFIVKTTRSTGGLL